MASPRLEHLVIKPTLACTARCPTCASRRELHRQARRERELTLADWRRVLAEARELGVWELTISGGEPTLFPHLVELIRIGRGYGWQVRLNSNGSLSGRPFAQTLIQAGLDIADISLYGSTPEIHDAMRGVRGLWARATAAIGFLAELRDENSGFEVITQTILCRENLDDFADLFHLHLRLGSGGVLLSYLEGDFEQRHLLTAAAVRHFREVVLPRALAVCDDLHPLVRRVARRRLSRLFHEEILPAEQWAAGIYRPGRPPCGIPSRLTIVLANGDVHPCNIVEYAHEPVMGNVLAASFQEIWGGERWRQYRQELHPRCHLCPMNHHVYVPLRPPAARTARMRLWLQRLQLDALDRRVYSRLQRFRARRRSRDRICGPARNSC